MISIRRIDRGVVVARAGRDFLRRATGHWDEEDFVVRAGGFDFVNVTRVGDFLAIG
jgi:hypothetical protein